ncbi:hypothetical protein HK101_002811, partial [Irineochytrium annulatum]
MKWDYSPLTNGDYITGDYVHIKGECADDATIQKLATNFTLEYWYMASPLESWSQEYPHLFSMSQEHNFHQTWVPDLPDNSFHFAVVSDNYNNTVYLNGTAVSSLYCASDFTAAPVWAIGIRDWATNIVQVNTLQPIYPYCGDMAEFRVWTRPLSQAEIVSKMYRTLNPTEMQDNNLLLYLDFNNITNGVVPDLSVHKRLTGYLGGVLNRQVNMPIVRPLSVPVVNLRLSSYPVQMKESGDYPSVLPISINTISSVDASSVLLSGTPAATYTLQSLPDPKILKLSTSMSGSAITAAGQSLGSNSVIYATHIANVATPSWPTQSFNVLITAGNSSITVNVVITIIKNARPLVGDTGGAIVPRNVPDTVVVDPIRIPNFMWKNGSYDPRPLTWEWWIVPSADGRNFYAPDLAAQANGRFSAEANAAFVFDYGWQYAGAGRNMAPNAQNYFGLWTHVCLISDGTASGTNRQYVNGQLVTTSGGSAGPFASFTGDPSTPDGYMKFLLQGTVAIDEFRLWETNRTIEDVRATMYSKLNGTEKGLYMYHNFDSYTVQADGSYMFKDMGPHHFDAVCSDYDGVSPCPLVSSSAPIGGHVTDLIFEDGNNYTLWDPVGQDPDDDTMWLRFVVDTVTVDATMMYDKNYTFRRQDGDLRQGHSNMQYVTPITPGSYIRRELFEPAVKIFGSADGGGKPYDSFTYHVTDYLMNSKKGTINLIRKCAPGTFHDPAAKKCHACPIGTYTNTYGWPTSCTPCPAGTAQSGTGQTTCAGCSQVTFNTPVNGTFPVVTIGTSTIVDFGSYQPQSGQSSCQPCMGLSYALTANATVCGGQAFIPSYISYSAGSSPESRAALQDSVTASAITGSPKGVIVAALVLAIVTLLSLIGLYVYHANPVVKASSPIFMTMIAIGIIMGCFSVVPYSLRPSNATCIAEIWMFPISFSIVIGSLISKTFRIMRIFSNPKAMKMKITNGELFGYTAVAVALNSAVLIVWTIVDPPVPTVIQR